MPADIAADPGVAAMQRRWSVLAVVAAAEFVCVLDTTVVTIALPRLASALAIDAVTLPWVFDAYTLIFGSLLLLGGRAADLLGRRRVFLCGIALFSLASLACGLATSGAALLAARVAQGVGAALLSPAALSIVATAFPSGRERTIAMGIWSGLGGLGATIGMAFGGLLVDLWGWPCVFYVNLPIGCAAFIAGLWLLPRPAARPPLSWQQADLPGALAATGGLLLTVYTVIETRAEGWTSWPTLAGAAGAAGLLAFFWRAERRAPAPLLPARLALLPSLLLGGAGQSLTGAVQLSVMFLVSLDVQQVLGLNPFQAGLSFVPIGAVATVAAVMGAPAIDRYGSRIVYTLGALLGVAGLLALAWQCERGLPLWAILAPMLLIAVSLPTTSTTTTIIGLSRVPARDTGLAAGLLTVYFQIGAALGVAITATAAVDGLLYGYLAVATMALLNLAPPPPGRCAPEDGWRSRRASAARPGQQAERQSDPQGDQHRHQGIAQNTGLDLAARGTNTVLRVGGRAGDLVPGAAGDLGDAMAGGLRLLLQQLAHVLGKSCDVVAQRGQIRADISGGALGGLDHECLQQAAKRQ